MPATSRSPSPSLPPAPTVSQPGPRYLALQKIFTSALTATLATNSYANFAACFPTPAAHCPAALDGVWKQLNEKLRGGCIREFDSILAERNVREGLDSWDQAVEEGRRRRDRAVEGEVPVQPIHTLSVQELYAAHLSPYLALAAQRLEAELSEAQAQNQRLMARVQEQRREIEGLVGGLEGVVRDLEGAVGELKGELGGGGLRREAGELEGALSST